MLLTEWPTKTASFRSKLAADLDDVVGIAGQARIFGPLVGAQGPSRRRRRGRTGRCGNPFRTPAPRTATCSGRSRSHGRTSSPARQRRGCARCFARLLPAFDIPLFLATCLFLAGISSSLRVLMLGMGPKECSSRGDALRNDCWTRLVSSALPRPQRLRAQPEPQG